MMKTIDHTEQLAAELGHALSTLREIGSAAITGPCFKTKMEAFSALEGAAKSWGIA
jgi:hypothetical protein